MKFSHSIVLATVASAMAVPTPQSHRDHTGPSGISGVFSKTNSDGVVSILANMRELFTPDFVKEVKELVAALCAGVGSSGTGLGSLSPPPGSEGSLPTDSSSSLGESSSPRNDPISSSGVGSSSPWGGSNSSSSTSSSGGSSGSSNADLAGSSSSGSLDPTSASTGGSSSTSIGETSNPAGSLGSAPADAIVPKGFTSVPTSSSGSGEGMARHSHGRRFWAPHARF